MICRREWRLGDELEALETMTAFEQEMAFGSVEAATTVVLAAADGALRGASAANIGNL